MADAGLSRVTVSMDAVDAERFARITRVPNGYERVLAGIRAAQRAGLNPVKVNCVLLRGFNDDQITAFGRFAREEGVVVRFIEFMPLEEDRVWTPEIVVTLDEIVRRMAEFMPLREIEHARSETARRYVFEDGIGEIGIIAPVSHPFCGHCSRVRVTSDGKIRTCLFSVREHDLAGADGRPAPATKRWPSSSSTPSIRKKSATTSASRDLSRPRGRWCISGGSWTFSRCFRRSLPVDTGLA